MKLGDELQFIPGEGPPLLSPTFPLVIAALTCGLGFVDDKPLLDTIEEKGDEIERRHVWTINARSRAIFKLPGGTTETIDLPELERRFNSLDWCQNNHDHPIAYLRAFVDFRAAAVNDVKKMRPLLRVTRNCGEGDTRQVLIPHDATPEEKEKFLAELNA